MGGLGLFLIGMNMMSGPQGGCRPKLKAVLESMTRRPLLGLPWYPRPPPSSRAVLPRRLLIGLVNAGLMTVRKVSALRSATSARRHRMDYR